jgi:hypothetical protein
MHSMSVALYYSWFQSISVLIAKITFSCWGCTFINMFMLRLPFHNIADKSPLTPFLIWPVSTTAFYDLGMQVIK